VAAQIVAGRNREVGVTLTPAGAGTFEIYLDGDLVYNRKQLPTDGVLKDPVGDVRNGVSVSEMIRTKLLSSLEAATEAAAAAAPAH
jgi:predicted Rdx family selenoprotein